MWKEQRQKKILDIIALDSSHSVGSLAEQFNLSEITIRKDIKELSDQGLITRKYGSFTINTNTEPFPPKTDFFQYTGTPVTNRQQEDYEIKEQLAQSIVSKLLEVSTVFIDDSSTVLCLLPFLKEFSGLTIITPSIVAINYLSFIPNIHTIGLGGTVCTIHKAFIGATTIEQVKSYDIDLAIFGCFGISEEQGCVENFHSITGIKKQVSLQSRENIVLMSGRKWTQNQGVPSLSWENISAIISNQHPLPSQEEQINKHNIKLILV